MDICKTFAAIKTPTLKRKKKQQQQKENKTINLFIILGCVNNYRKARYRSKNFGTPLYIQQIIDDNMNGILRKCLSYRHLHEGLSACTALVKMFTLYLHNQCLDLNKK